MIPRRFDPAVPEMMDRRGHDPRLLRADLAVLAAFNRWCGGYRLPLHYLEHWRRAGRFRDARPLTVLDLACGGADVTRAIVGWARRHQLAITVTAVDNNPEILAHARAWSAAFPEIRFERQNLLALPYPARSHDLVLNALTLHHFAAPAVVAILRRIHDIARIGWLVNDLRRHRVAIGSARLMARTIISNPIARFDAPASCARAFTAAELRTLAARAGLTDVRLARHWAFRMVLVGARP